MTHNWEMISVVRNDYAVPASFYATGKAKPLPPVLKPKPFATDEVENMK